MAEVPKIAISSCLAGDMVRYNGSKICFDYFQSEILPRIKVHKICPETGIGLSVPRDPIQIVNIHSKHILRSVSDPNKDYTELMLRYVKNVLPSFDDVCGYIVKQRSPSCGLNDTPIYSATNEKIETGTGLFTSAIVNHLPWLPIIDEEGLKNEQQRDHFWERVFIVHLFNTNIRTDGNLISLQEFYSLVECNVCVRGKQSRKTYSNNFTQKINQHSNDTRKDILTYLMKILNTAVNKQHHVTLLHNNLKNTVLNENDNSILIRNINLYSDSLLQLWDVLDSFKKILNKNNKTDKSCYFYPDSNERALRSSTFY